MSCHWYYYYGFHWLYNIIDCHMPYCHMPFFHYYAIIVTLATATYTWYAIATPLYYDWLPGFRHYHFHWLLPLIILRWPILAAFTHYHTLSLSFLLLIGFSWLRCHATCQPAGWPADTILMIAIDIGRQYEAGCMAGLTAARLRHIDTSADGLDCWLPLQRHCIDWSLFSLITSGYYFLIILQIDDYAFGWYWHIIFATPHYACRRYAASHYAIAFYAFAITPFSRYDAIGYCHYWLAIDYVITTAIAIAILIHYMPGHT